MNTFPFDIVDVATILNLTLRHKKAGSLDYDCPFCGRKGKLNINLNKNAYRCNACGEGGGMLNLYANLEGLSKSDSYRKLDNIINGEKDENYYKTSSAQHSVDTMHNKDVRPIEPALIKSRHQAYTLMLEFLTLNQEHRDMLSERGLTPDNITSVSYRSVPAKELSRLYTHFKECGIELNGVPGFYTKGSMWKANFPYWSKGIMIPIKSVEGLINGFQIRLDKPIGSMKYTWFSSTDLENGTSAGSPVHFVGNKTEKTIYVTEGALKANIAHSVTGWTFIAVPGANQYKSLATELRMLKSLGSETVVEAYDADKYTNEQVEKGCRRMMKTAENLGFNVRRLKWDERYKGIDDYVIAKRKS